MKPYQTATQKYNLSAIRRLLPKVLNVHTLPLLCYDYFPQLYQRLTADLSLRQMTQWLVDEARQRNQLDYLLPQLRDLNPDQFLEYDPAFRRVANAHQKKIKDVVRIYLSYNARLRLDRQLAAYLYQFLSKLGHKLFLDYPQPSNEAHLTEIDNQIRRSDFIITLLSEESVDNEMLRAQMSRADEYERQQGQPQTILVNLAYEGLLPYSLESHLKRAHTLHWRDLHDHETVALGILNIIEARQRVRPRQPEIAFPPAERRSPQPRERLSTDEMLVSEDGWPIEDEDELYPPLPEFDPRFLEELRAPGGAVKVRDRFYVERRGDRLLNRQLDQPTGTTTTIRAARQMGKSSLLVRGMHHARQQRAQIAYIDLQGTDNRYLTALDPFLRHIAELIVRRLRLDLAEVDRAWQGSFGPKDTITYFMEDYVLQASEQPLVLALDEVDLLVRSDSRLHTEFFSLLRSWHNNRATDFDGLWDKLSIVMAISTEPYLLIEDVHQSPFNVGLKIFLEDFDPTQVYELNWKHGAPVKSQQFGEFMRLFNGHPYLTRKALYTMVTQSMSWAELYEVADDDNGPFNDHLLRNYWLLMQDEQLARAFLEIIRTNTHHDDLLVLRLLKAGLITGEGIAYTPRCDLYRRYFESKLRR